MKKIKKIVIMTIFILAIAACSNMRFDMNEECEYSAVAVKDVNKKTDDYIVKEENCEEEELPFAMSNSIADDKETNADNYDAMDKVRRFRQYDMERIEFQANWPCHFLIYLNMLSSDWEIYRNINTENMADEDGQIPMGCQQLAYLADIIVDKYIREYGGADVKYTVYEEYWENDMFPDTPEGIYYLVITAEDGTQLIALWNACNVFSVLIANERETAETKEAELIKYLECIEEQQVSQAEDNRFQMVINTEQEGSICYRNINQDMAMTESDLEYTTTDFLIADQIIDRYIRDYKGSDTVYKLYLNKPDFMHDEKRVLKIEHDDEILEAEYSDVSWAVNVKIQNGNLGFVSQKDINDVGNQRHLKKLRIVIQNANLDLSPLTNLPNMEEIYITIRTDSKNLDLSPIGELTQLKTFYLCDANYLNLSFLEKLEQLEKLEIVNSKLENLSFLQGLGQLKYLSLSQVADAGLSYLKSAKNLTDFFYLEGYHIRNLEVLSEAKNMERLFLFELESDYAKREEIQMELFSGMQNLKSLTLVQINAHNFDLFAKFKNLEELVLADVGIEDIQCLNSLKKLKELKIFGGNSSVLAEQAQRYLPELDYIWIDDELPYDYRIVIEQGMD